MPLPRTAKVGLAVIAIGLLPIVAFSIWRATLNTVPVKKPISLAVGHLRESFTVNFTGLYTMRIEVERKLPHATIQCLLGISDYVPEGQCNNIAPVLKLTWALTHDGQAVKTWTTRMYTPNGLTERIGSSSEHVAAAYTNDTVAAEFAYFEARRGERYTLNMDILEDGSALSVTNPKLRIGVDESVYEGFISLELITFGWAVLGCLIGGVTLLVSLLRARRNKRMSVAAKSSPAP